MCWNPCDRTGSLQTGFVRFERAMADPGPLTRRTVRCSSRWVWSSRLGLGGELDPGGRDGHSPSRRPGGPAPKRWQRRPRRPPVTPRTHPKPTASTCGDRWGQRESIRQLATRGTFGPCGSGRNPNRERWRSGVFPGDRRGRSTPRQSSRVIHGGYPSVSCKLFIISMLYVRQRLRPYHFSRRDTADSVGSPWP